MAAITFNGTSINFSVGIEAFKRISTSFLNSKKLLKVCKKRADSLLTR